MISYSQGPTKISLPSGAGFQEAPWVYKRGSTYYVAYAGTCCSENIRYMTGSSPTGPFTYKGVIMPTQGKSFTNHQALIDFNGHSYFFYHNGALPGGSGYQRSACVEEFKCNPDGTIPTIQMTAAGVAQLGTLNPYVRQEAETIAFSANVKTETCSEGGLDVTGIKAGSYIKVKGAAFGSAGAKSLAVRVAGTGSGSIAVRLGSTGGALVGTCNVAATGGAQVWKTVECAISGAAGTQDVFFVLGGSGWGFNWWQFTQK
jgi:arabinoxylan arabinofuranohydrolase